MLDERAGAPSIHSPPVDLEVVAKPLAELDVDAVAVALAVGDGLPTELADAPGAGEVKTGKDRLALLYPKRPPRALAVGLGDPEEVGRERLRVAAANVAKRAGGAGARSIGWLVPSAEGIGAGDVAQAIVEGTVLGSYRFDGLRSADPEDPPPAEVERLVLVGDEPELGEIEARANVGRIASEAANRARDLQNAPSNLLTPEGLAERAFEIAAEQPKVTAGALDREAIAAAGLGGLVAVSQGSATEPRLITMRYGGGGVGPVGLVGKAVTFDSGGISIKPSQGMHEMKMDMSGGAAVLEAIGAIAELDLGCDLVAAIPATENMPSGTATKPGDVITQANGKTVEVNNTDAEGRLILADALTYCVRELGAERLVDLATLTGAVVIALGSTYSALISNDDDWAAEVTRAAEKSGELAWRLPLHDEYKQLTKGTVADLTNAASKRKASTIYAGSFLEEFVDGVPWAHLDIAGTAWDTGREYVGNGPTGVGVRLLVALAEQLQTISR